MKNKQTIGIILVFSLIIGVFCGCKAKEPEFIPDTPEITFLTEETEAVEETASLSEETEKAGDSEDSAQAVGTTQKTTAKTTQTTESKSTEKNSDSAKKTTNAPDNSVETKPKATTTAKNTEKNTTTTKKAEKTTAKQSTTAKQTTTQSGGNVTTTKKDQTPTGTTKPTESTTEFTTVKSEATITPITAEFTYLNDPKNSFMAKLTHEDLAKYGMNEAEKSAFLSDRSGWAEYTVRIDVTNNDESGSATVYLLDISDNGKDGVYVNCDVGGEMSIAPGKTSYILFNVLVKDSSMMETIVHKTVDGMTKKLKYAATPEHDMDVPNYKYITVE